MNTRSGRKVDTVASNPVSSPKRKQKIITKDVPEDDVETPRDDGRRSTRQRAPSKRLLESDINLDLSSPQKKKKSEVSESPTRKPSQSPTKNQASPSKKISLIGLPTKKAIPTKPSIDNPTKSAVDKPTPSISTAKQCTPVSVKLTHTKVPEQSSISTSVTSKTTPLEITYQKANNSESVPKSTPVLSSDSPTAAPSELSQPLATDKEAVFPDLQTKQSIPAPLPVKKIICPILSTSLNKKLVFQKKVSPSLIKPATLSSPKLKVPVVNIIRLPEPTKTVNAPESSVDKVCNVVEETNDSNQPPEASTSTEAVEAADKTTIIKVSDVDGPDKVVEPEPPRIVSLDIDTSLADNTAGYMIVHNKDQATSQESLQTIFISENPDGSFTLTSTPEDSMSGVIEDESINSEAFKERKLSFARRKEIDSLYLEVIVHGDSREFKCKQCGYSANAKGAFYRHTATHEKVPNTEKKFTCDQCNYKGISQSNLSRHFLTHTDIKLFKCEECGLSFRQKIHCLRHIKYKHKAKTVQCPLCEYTCATENPDLKIHMKRRHTETKDDPEACVCNVCGAVANSIKDLKQHVKFHKKGPELKFFCEQCSFVTNAKSRLERHLLTHTKTKPYQCGLCSYQGTQKEHVVRHMETKHGIVRQRVRQPRKSKAITDLEGAYDKGTGKSTPPYKVEPADKVFGCNFCDLRFSKLINLYKHLHLMHPETFDPDEGGEKCVLCDFKTRNKKLLLAHMRKHTETMVASNVAATQPLYSCVMCDYQNLKRRNLYQHLKKKHKISIVVKKDGTAQCIVEESSNLQVVTSSGKEGKMTSSTTLLAIEQNPESGSSPRIINITDIAQSLLKKNTDAPATTGCDVITDGIVAAAGNPIQVVGPDMLHHDVNVSEYAAAEAIQGLQALSVPLLAPPISDNGSSDTSKLERAKVGPPMSSLGNHAGQINDQTIKLITKKSDSSGDMKANSNIELEPEQLMNLSTGDFIVIDGEAYKVEFTSNDNTASSILKVSEEQHETMLKEIGLVSKEPTPQEVSVETTAHNEPSISKSPEIQRGDVIVSDANPASNIETVAKNLEQDIATNTTSMASGVQVSDKSPAVLDVSDKVLKESILPTKGDQLAETSIEGNLDHLTDKGNKTIEK